jgi:hypothetical protein
MRAAILACVLVGCGGSVAAESPILYDDAGNPILDTSGLDGDRDARFDGRDTGRDTSVRDTAPEVWVDPECPDIPPPPPAYECDPLKAPPGDCPRGEACFPYVIYPTEPCEHETYASTCYPAGTGKQGDPCGSSGTCSAGFACVASGAGNVCVKLCKPGAPGGCSEGLVCHTTDVPGVGGCM